jgi:hypothetical protein
MYIAIGAHVHVHVHVCVLLECFTCTYTNILCNSPSCDMIDEVLLEHETPSLDDSEQGLLERPGIHTEPYIKHCSALLREFMVKQWTRIPNCSGKGRYTRAGF